MRSRSGRRLRDSPAGRPSPRRRSSPRSRFTHTRVITRLSTDADALDDPFVAAALRFVRNNLSQKLDAAMIARKVGYSKRMLQIRAEHALGHTLGEEIRRIRLAAARELIAETDNPLAEIAEDCGFSSVSHLTLRFREAFNMTPLAFRHSQPYHR
jgi:LacI family transcriptional regulator